MYLIPWFQLQPYTVHLPFTHSTMDLQPFGFLVWIGTVLGMWLATRLGREQGLDDLALRDLIFHCVLYGFIGSYVLNAVFYEASDLKEMIHEPHLLVTRWLGLSSVGGVVAGWFGALVWKWRTNKKLIPYIDCVGAGLTLGFFFGRIGCFTVHDHPGHVSDFFLAIDDFHTGNLPYLPRHDLGLYEAIVFGVLLLLFFALFRKTDLKRGYYCAFALFYYAPIRFALDFLRASDAEGGDVRYFGFTPAQYSSLAFLVLAGWLLHHARALTAAGTGTQRSVVAPSPPASGAAAPNSKADSP